MPVWEVKRADPPLWSTGSTDDHHIYLDRGRFDICNLRRLSGLAEE